MSESVDLFGQPTGPAQFSLFGEGENRLRPPERKVAPPEERARARLTELLATARAARTMPWSERDARMWQTVFPQMADWLPEEEAAQLRLEFAREIERLCAA